MEYRGYIIIMKFWFINEVNKKKIIWRMEILHTTNEYFKNSQTFQVTYFTKKKIPC